MTTVVVGSLNHCGSNSTSEAVLVLQSQKILRLSALRIQF